MKANFDVKVDMIVVKVVVIALLIVIMMIPIEMVKSLIEEREQNQQKVQNEIGNKWGGKQTITGPVLVLPYTTTSKIGDKNTVNYAYFLPEEYKVEGDIMTEERSRTLFKTLVYQSDLNISGSFSFPDYAKLNLTSDQILWKDAFIIVGIPHLQGIKNKIVFNVNDSSRIVQPGVQPNSVVSSGITIEMPIDNNNTSNFNFNFDLALNGSEGLYFNPVGKETHVHLKSQWKTVSFGGDFLPGSRILNNEGFDANWDVFDYNRNYVQAWVGTNDILKLSFLGVDLKFPVDQYQMTMRSVKYAIMFIALTFVVFFLVELLSRKRIHPIQYLLVSCALILFYTLLLSISEHISFGWSYLISASATTILVTAYSATMFRNLKQTAMMGLFLTILYTYLYVILQQENMSLLFGSIGLFIALAIIMFALRNINWYKPKDNEPKDNKTTAIIGSEASPIHNNID